MNYSLLRAFANLREEIIDSSEISESDKNFILAVLTTLKANIDMKAPVKGTVIPRND